MVHLTYVIEIDTVDNGGNYVGCEDNSRKVILCKMGEVLSALFGDIMRGVVEAPMYPLRCLTSG